MTCLKHFQCWCLKALKKYFLAWKYLKKHFLSTSASIVIIVASQSLIKIAHSSFVWIYSLTSVTGWGSKKRFSGFPASSAVVERIFSIAGTFFRPDRCLLSDDNFQKLMFIKKNEFMNLCITVFPRLECARSISFKWVAGRRCIRGRVLFEGAVYSFQPLGY